MPNISISTILIIFLFSGNLVVSAQLRRQPIPLEIVTAYRQLLDRVPLDVSSDGEWLSYTVDNPELHMVGQGYYYSNSGVPVGLGRELWLTNIRTKETVKLSRPGRSSWAGAWSPDNTN